MIVRSVVVRSVVVRSAVVPEVLLARPGVLEASRGVGGGDVSSTREVPVAACKVLDADMSTRPGVLDGPGDALIPALFSLVFCISVVTRRPVTLDGKVSSDAVVVDVVVVSLATDDGEIDAVVVDVVVVSLATDDGERDDAIVILGDELATPPSLVVRPSLVVDLSDVVVVDSSDVAVVDLSDVEVADSSDVAVVDLSDVAVMDLSDVSVVGVPDVVGVSCTRVPFTVTYLSAKVDRAVGVTDWSWVLMTVTVLPVNGQSTFYFCLALIHMKHIHCLFLYHMHACKNTGIHACTHTYMFN